ncbi:pimeloyl-ACP methyl ester carboxylesterase [Pseudonocardia eucalypti]|uniref:alpha/beta hydrolase n=1 Tax=Pseudonocardia eucalypti TaxID=648755 RepID=UPI00183B46EB|nr:pimeloyl-ACP methyl ester carboxylesterase [Pseudonocardia eucalypti]
MRGGWRRVGAGMLLLGCVLGVVAVPPYADELADAAATPALEWRDCAEGFQCATAQVPLDYREPERTKIDLALIKLPASDPSRRIGTLFVNFGGPGPSGVDRMRQRARWPWLFSEELRARFDLVSWDPRGVNRSTSVRCFPDDAQRNAFFTAFPDVPDTPAGEPAFFRASRELADRCAQQSGWLLPHLNSVNTVRDLDLLRRAVGDAKLTYHGISYGTYLGALYANLFPGRVRALALDATLDPLGNAVGHASSALHRPVDTRQGLPDALADTFHAFRRECAAAGPSRCAFAGGDLAALVDRARRRPIPLTEPDGTRVDYTSSKIIELVAGLDVPGDWPDAAATLRRLADTAPATRPTGVPEAPDPQPYPANRTEAYNAIQCADSATPRSESDYSALAAAEDARVPYFGRRTVYNMMTCAYWPAEAVAPYTGRWDRIPANPVLVINSRVDPATPHPGAVDTVRLLARARLLTVDGAGHSTMFVRSLCAERVKREYLIDGILPPEGTSCPVDRSPFAP